MGPRYGYNPDTGKMEKLPKGTPRASENPEAFEAIVRNKQRPEIAAKHARRGETMMREANWTGGRATNHGQRHQALVDKLAGLGMMIDANLFVNRGIDEINATLKNSGLKCVVGDDGEYEIVSDGSETDAVPTWLLGLLPQEYGLGGLVDDLPFSMRIFGKMQASERYVGERIFGSVRGGPNLANDSLTPNQDRVDVLRRIGEHSGLARNFAIALRDGHVDGIGRFVGETGILLPTMIGSRVDLSDEDRFYQLMACTEPASTPPEVLSFVGGQLLKITNSDRFINPNMNLLRRVSNGYIGNETSPPYSERHGTLGIFSRIISDTTYERLQLLAIEYNPEV